ncbi:MAG: helix-turn-helix domain-containing protein [Pseudomonadota bacterium]
MTRPPEPVERPSLALWMWRRNLRAPQAAKALGVTPEQVRRYCLEFGHPQRAMPGREVLERIAAWTDGEVTERDFYPPHIRGEAPTPAPALTVVEGGA